MNCVQRAHLAAEHAVPDRTLDVRPRDARVAGAEHAAGAVRVVDVRGLGVLDDAQGRTGDAVARERPSGAGVQRAVDAAAGRREDHAADERGEAPDRLRARHAVVGARRDPGRAVVIGAVDAAARHAGEQRPDERAVERLDFLVELLRVLRIVLGALREGLPRTAADRLEEARRGAREDRGAGAAGEDRADVHGARDVREAGVHRVPGDPVGDRAVDAPALGGCIDRRWWCAGGVLTDDEVPLAPYQPG